MGNNRKMFSLLGLLCKRVFCDIASTFSFGCFLCGHVFQSIVYSSLRVGLAMHVCFNDIVVFTLRPAQNVKEVSLKWWESLYSTLRWNLLSFSFFCFYVFCHYVLFFLFFYSYTVYTFLCILSFSIFLSVRTLLSSMLFFSFLSINFSFLCLLSFPFPFFSHFSHFSPF